MKRKKPVNSDYLVNIEPLTDNQKLLFDAYSRGQHIVAFGCAGTGKLSLVYIMRFKMY